MRKRKVLADTAAAEAVTREGAEMDTRAAQPPAAALETGRSSELEKTLRWWDGVTITLGLPAALFVGLAASVGALGAWTAIALWAAIAAIAVLHNWIYSEMASMFPDKSGGIALFASQAWQRRAPAIGPLATYAYWFAWATAPAIWGLSVAGILTSQFWPDSTWSTTILGIDFDLSRTIALAVAVVSWLLAMFRLSTAKWIMTVVGVSLMVPVAIFGTVSFADSGWSTSSFTWSLPSGGEGLRTALAWLFIMAWSAYAIEAAASFVPEFRDTVRDTRRSIRVAGLVFLAVAVLTPIGIAGLLGQDALAAAPYTFLGDSADVLFGGGAALVTILLIGGIMLLSVMGTADAGRALYQSSLDGLTVRQFGTLDRRGVPARALTIQLLINVALVLFVGNALAVIVAGNVGFVLAHLLAVAGFLLLRRDAPGAPRPIRLGRGWFGIGVALVVFDAVILVAGVTSASITGYGGLKEILISVGVLSISQLLFLVRRWQDRRPAVPSEPAAGAAVAP